MPGSSRIISEMLPESHTIEKYDYLKSVIHCPIILFSLVLGRHTKVANSFLYEYHGRLWEQMSARNYLIHSIPFHVSNCAECKVSRP